MLWQAAAQDRSCASSLGFGCSQSCAAWSEGPGFRLVGEVMHPSGRIHGQFYLRICFSKRPLHDLSARIYWDDVSFPV